MSKSIEERVVQMRFDNKQFESGVQTTLSTLDKLKQGLKFTDASKGLENVTAAAKNCDMSGVSKAVETISVKFSAMEVMAITALQNITNSALYYGNKIVSALTVDPIKTGLAEYETKINAIQVIQANTRGVNSMDEITAALDELNTYADKTIYNFAQMTSNIGKFTAQGLDVNEATKAVQGMANLAAASGASAEDMSRATYQMSQALSGTIRKIDWNSLRNANMATQTLKNILIDIAKVEESLDVGAMIADKGTFEDTLELGWLSGDLFTRAMNVYSGVYTEAELIAKGYTAEQIKNFQEIAKTAESAATEVKTISQLWDVLKETAQSGWTQTWEYVIGDFETAKKTLTKAQVYLSDMINSSADTRNAVMKAWNEAGGRDDLIQSLVNAFQGLLSVAKPIKEAYDDIFPPMTAERLLGITSALKEFTKHLTIGGTTANDLKRSFKGVFAVFDIGLQLLKALGSGAADLVRYFLPAGSSLLELTGNLGDFLVSVDETIKTTDVFGNTVKKITGSIKIFADFLKQSAVRAKGFAHEIRQKIDFQSFELLHDILERVHIRMAEVGEVAGDMKSAFVIAVTAMGAALANCKFLQALDALWKGVKTIIGGVLSILGDFAAGIAEKIGNADFNGIFDIINSLLAGGIGVGIYKFINTLNDVSEIAGSFKESLLDILGGVKDCLTEYQNSLKAKTLMTIAGAIGILAAALVVLSLIDSEKLSASLGAMTVMFADLVTGMAVLGKVGNLGAVGKMTTAMVGVSVSVLILASALKKIGSLNIGQMATGLAGVIGLTATVSASMIMLSKFAQNGVKGATQMVILSAALKILSDVLTDISGLDLVKIGKGLLGVLGLMGTLVGSMVLLSNFAQNGVRGATSMLILSAAVKVLASVLKEVGTLDIKTIGKGILSVVALMGTLTGAMILVSNFAKSGVKGATQMVIMSAAIVILSNVLKDLGTLDVKTIGKGLLGVVGLMGSLAGAMILLSKFATNAASMLAAGAAMVIVAASIKILAGVLKEFGTMNLGTLIQGLIGIGVLLLEVALMLNAMQGCLGGAAALLIISGALLALTPVLSILGAMPIESIVKALASLAGVFVILGVAGAVLSGLIPAILGLSGAIALIGVGIVAFGAGLLLTGIGITAIATGLTALAVAVTGGATAIVAGLTVIISGVAGLIPVVLAKLGEGIIEFCKVIADGAPAIGKAVVSLVLTVIGVLVECVPALVDGVFAVIVGVLEAMVTYGPQIVSSIMLFLIGVLNELASHLPELIVAAVSVIMAFFQGVVDALSRIDTEVLLKGIVGVGILAGVMTALSAVAALVPGAMVGVLGMGAVIAELALVLAAIGAFAQIPGLSWLIGEGGTFMGQIGNAIGSFIGGILGGIMDGVSSALPNIGSDLSAFMTNMQPFFDGAQRIDPTMLEGVNALAKTILILTAANILDGLTSWLTGGSSMSDFAAELVPFGVSMKAYGDAIAGLDANTVAASATAAMALAELASKLPNSGGLAGWFAGENDMAVFGEQLIPFGKGLKAYSLAVAGLDSNAIENSTVAAQSLAKLADNLPNSGGLAGWFAGDNDMATFGASLVSFGENFAKYSDYMKNVDSGIVTTTTNAAHSIVELQNSLPKDGGWFSDDMTLSDFGSDMSSFGSYFADYYASISSVNIQQLAGVVSEANNLVKMAEGMTNLDTSGMTGFGKALVKLGNDGITDFINAFSNAESKVINAASAMLTAFMNGANTKKTLLTTTFTSLAEVILTTINGKQQSFNTTGSTLMVKLIAGVKSQDTNSRIAFVNIISGCLTALKNKYPEFNTVGTQTMVKLIAGVKSQDTATKTSFTTVITGCLTALKNKYSEFETVGKTCMTKFIEGIKAENENIKSNFTNVLSGVVSTIRDYHDDFYSAGEYLVEGFADGIDENNYKAAAAATAMARAAANAAKKELDEHSPSKVGYEIGDFFGIAFVNAIASYGKKAYDVSANMASMAKSGLTTAVSQIADWIDSDMDTQPTIRPVLDLSAVEDGARRLNTMFSYTQALVAGNGVTNRRNNSNEEQENQNGTNASSGNTYLFTQNNYSPKALSRIEIYRQTRNQFTAMKEVLS